MTRSFHHDGARYGVTDRACVLNGRRMNQWHQWRLMSGAYILIRSIWLPPSAQRADVIDAMAAQWSDDKVTVTVIPIALGWLVRVRGDDQATLGGQNLFTNEADALAYARRIAC